MSSEPVSTLGPDSMVGSYRLVREIGRGGMATVYEAQHVSLPRRAAIKIMHAELREYPGMATRLVQEAAILEELRHAGIVRVYDCSVLPDRRPWIAMELIEGDTLAARLVRCSSLPAAEVCRLLADVGDVLAAAHAREIVHRDLKPENLLLPVHDKEFPLRVIDWGVARLGVAGRITVEGMTPGTPIYMSPEQACGKHIAAPCDIYSLGVIGYELLTGAPPFDGRTMIEVVSQHLTATPAPLRALCPAAPIELCALIHRMLEKDPARRPTASDIRHTCRSLAIELATIYEEIVVSMETSVDTVVIDPEALELGTTQQLSYMRRPRWTPDGVYAAAALHGKAVARRPITPDVVGHDAAGEILPPHLSRRQ